MRTSASLRVSLVAFLGTVCLLGCGPAGTGQAPIATWSGGAISSADYEGWRRVNELEDSHEAIREMAYVVSMAAAARARGAGQEPRARIELEAAQYKVLLAALRHHVEAAVEVRDDELEALRRQHPDAFQRSRKLRLRNIYRRLGDGPDAVATRARMAELHRQLLAGADFEEMAERESQSQSRVRGGALGFLAPDELPFSVAAALADLGPGQITEPIEHGNGMSIFLCEEVRAATVPSPAEVRDKLRANLLRQRTRERWTGLRADLLKEAAPQLRPGAEDIVLSIGDYQLDRAALAALVPFRLPGKTLTELDEAEVERLLTMWATGVACARHAVELGLDHEPSTAAALRWRELATLAHLELVRRIDERLKEPDDEAILRYYEAHRERYRQLASYRLAGIHLGTGKTRQQVEQAQAVARQLEIGALTFGAAARAHSIDPSAADGGSLGWLELRQLASYGPIATKAVRQLQPGQRTGLLHVRSGLWIFELRGVREARSMSFDEARTQARTEVRRARIRELEQVIRTEQLQSLDLQTLELAGQPGQQTETGDGGAGSGRGQQQGSDRRP